MTGERVELNPNPQVPIEIPRDRRGRIRWAVVRNWPPDLQAEAIEQEARVLLEQGVKLTCSGLRDSGNIGFAQGVYRYYPRAVNGLQEQLGLTQNSEGVLRDSLGRVRWKLSGNTYEENMQLGIHNIQALFLERFPLFDQMFPREKGTIPVDKKEEARQLILRELGSNLKMTNLTGTIPLSSRRTPYFLGSYQVVISKTFIPWGIDFPDFNDPLALPQVDKKTGIYVDENGESWSTVIGLADNFRVAQTYLRDYLHNVPSMMGKNRHGAQVILYNMSFAVNEIPPFANIPKVDKKTGIYVDENGESWSTTGYLARRFELSQAAVSSYLKKRHNRSRPGRPNRGSAVLLFHKLEAEEKLKAHFALPQVNNTTGIYVDENGESWVAENYFKKNGFYRPSQRKARSITKIEGRSAIGSNVMLYNLKEAIKILTRNTDIIQWTPETIEEEAYNFLQSHGDLSQRLLLTNRRYDLIHAIRSKYPGKWNALKKKIGVKETQAIHHPQGYWTTGNIEREALEFYSRYGALSQRLLQDKEKIGLRNAITRRYPGGMIALKDKLGIAQVDTLMTLNISPETANEQLSKLLE